MKTREMEQVVEASMDVGLEINTEKAKYMIMSRHPNSGLISKKPKD
jgi:hypothetical protein